MCGFFFYEIQFEFFLCLRDVGELFVMVDNQLVVYDLLDEIFEEFVLCFVEEFVLVIECVWSVEMDGFCNDFCGWFSQMVQSGVCWMFKYFEFVFGFL